MRMTYCESSALVCTTGGSSKRIGKPASWCALFADAQCVAQALACAACEAGTGVFALLLLALAGVSVRMSTFQVLCRRAG